MVTAEEEKAEAKEIFLTPPSSQDTLKNVKVPDLVNKILDVVYFLLV